MRYLFVKIACCPPRALMTDERGQVTQTLAGYGIDPDRPNPWEV